MFASIKIGSITNAQRASRVLGKASIKASINRLEKPSNEDGCGFVVRVPLSSVKRAVELLENNAITVIGVDGV